MSSRSVSTVSARSASKSWKPRRKRSHAASNLILSARLDHVAKILRDPAAADRSVSAIPSDAGFADLSHFY